MPTFAVPRLAPLKGRGRLALLAGSLDGLRRPHPSRSTDRRSALLLASSLAWLRRHLSPSATDRRPVWRLGAAAVVLGVTAYVAVSQASGNDATKTPTTPATATISQASTPSTSAPTPPVTPSVTRHATPVRGQDNGKKKGKQ